MWAKTEPGLAALAWCLLGGDAGLTSAERALLLDAGIASDNRDAREVAARIRAGTDPLGETFCAIRGAAQRRSAGATYTPPGIIDSMVGWAASDATPSRVIDPGAGSGRFILAAAKRFPDAELVAVETDPLAALMLRANAAVLGVSDRLTVKLEDYRAVRLPPTDGPSLFIGNPPYVRHHQIKDAWKTWFAEAAAARGIKASKLAGLHMHFFLKTLELASDGDLGAFITSAEWLDVNYGAVLRKLLADGLGGCALHVLDPNTMPFADATTTGAITCFRVGRRPKSLCVRTVDSPAKLERLTAGRSIPWTRFENARRWTTIIRPVPKPPTGTIELGEICRVHRGQVTGGNRVWIAGERAAGLPADVLVPTVTKAKELFEAGEVLVRSRPLRRVIDLPPDLDALAPEGRKAVDEFLLWARGQSAHQSYIARHRKSWWSVRLRDPAPILCTYMARRAPNFVRNLCGARHINIAHGLYPVEPLDDAVLDALAAYLRGNVSVRSGRTYAGGLTKFEPRELERVPVPALHMLACLTRPPGPSKP